MTKENGHQRYPAGKRNGYLARREMPHLTPDEDDIDPQVLAQIWAQRAQYYAAPLPIEPTGEKRELLVFSLQGERYGIDVNHVRAIHPLQRFTPVPRTPDFVIGIFSARGRLISIIDLCAFFGLGNIPLSDETKIVVVNDESSGMEVGFLANDIEDVVTVYEADLGPALATQVHHLAEYTQGIAPGLLVVLDIDALINDGQLIVNQEFN